MEEKKVFEICFTLAGNGRADLADKFSEIVPNKFKFAAGFATGWGRELNDLPTTFEEAWGDFSQIPRREVIL